MAEHLFTRSSQNVLRRTLRVISKQQFTPRMLRLVFYSDALGDFQSPSPDDHIRLYLPGGTIARDFTPREWDPAAKTLAVDFALHPYGPAVAWAEAVEPGEAIEIAGPRGSTIVPSDFEWYLLIGDATALPSIARRLELMHTHAAVHVIALVADSREERYLNEAYAGSVQWLHSTGNLEGDKELVLSSLRSLQTRTGDGFIWIAAEVSIARSAYRYAMDALAHPKEWVKAAGYWSADKPNGGERIA